MDQHQRGECVGGGRHTALGKWEGRGRNQAEVENTAMGGCYGWLLGVVAMIGCCGWLLWLVAMGGCYGWLLVEIKPKTSTPVPSADSHSISLGRPPVSSNGPFEVSMSICGRALQWAQHTSQAQHTGTAHRHSTQAQRSHSTDTASVQAHPASTAPTQHHHSRSTQSQHQHLRTAT